MGTFELLMGLKGSKWTSSKTSLNSLYLWTSSRTSLNPRTIYNTRDSLTWRIFQHNTYVFPLKMSY